MEIWKDIPSLPGYQASSDGRVRSVDRIVTDSRGHSYSVPGKTLTSSPNRMGYWRVGASGKTVSVHRVVLEAFAGPCPTGCEAAHNDGDRSNNSPSNLRWTTRIDNAADRQRHGTTYQPKGERHHLAKLTDDDVRAIRSDPRSNKAVAAEYGITSANAWAIRSGKTWTHVTQHFDSDQDGGAANNRPAEVAA